MRWSALLLVFAAVAGCGKKSKPADAPAPEPARTPVVAPPPAHSGADRAPGAAKGAGVTNWDGTGYPDRLLCTVSKAVRGDTVVQVVGAGSYLDDDFVLIVAVKNRGAGPLAFRSWHDSAKVTLKDDKGKVYPRRAADPEVQALRKEWAETRKADGPAGYGSGPVKRDRMRVSFVAFDRAAFGAEYVDVDLDGGAVGETDPIRFRVPKDLWERNQK